MEELDRALAIALTGEARERAVSCLRSHLARWDVAAPDIEPLVWDFGLEDFESVGLVEMWIANEVEAGYCGKYMFVTDGQTCPMHHHKTKHETFFVMEGRVRVVHNGKETELQKGDVLAVPPLTRHQFTGVGPALLLELSKPCLIDDNHFEDPRIPVGRKDA